MPVYTFRARLVLEPIRLQRAEDERMAEKIHNDFEHHINPFRDIGDEMQVHALVRTPDRMTDGQSAAFIAAMNRSLEQFGYEFDRELRICEEKANHE